jgi:hypothetical protein
MITIILFIFLLLFGGCRSVLGLGLLYTPLPPAVPVILPTVVVIEASPTFTFTPNHSKGEPSVTPTYTITPTATSTFTPTPFVTPSADNVPCTVAVRQPPANSPTQIPNNLGTPSVGVPIDVHLAYCMNLGTVGVGDTWQLLVRAVDMELPVYYLTITNDDSEELSIRYDPASPADFEFSSDLSSVSIMSATTHRQSQTLFTFIVNEVDVVEISLFATGLVQYDYSNPAISTSTPSETFFLAINE